MTKEIKQDVFKKSKIPFLLATTILFLVTFFAYSLGVSGPFLLDDFTNFSRLEYVNGSLNGYLLAIFENNGEVLNRPLSYASFLINAHDWPNNPAGFKYVNIALHLLCGLVLLLCLKQMPCKRPVAEKKIFGMFVVGLWLLSPLSVSTVLYAVQRMTILSSLFSLLSILFYLKARKVVGIRESFLFLVFSGLFALLSFLSKENGILIVPLVALLHIYLKDEQDISPSPKWLDSLVIVGVVAFVCIYLYLFKLSLPGYDSRTFSLIERILLQGKILFDYIYLSWIPNISYMSLHHDGYEVITKYSLLLGGVSWAAHLAIIATGIKFWNKNKVIGFSIMWFYIGHLIESTFVPLELMFEHRNYLPGIGLYILASYFIVSFYSKYKPVSAWMKPVVFSLPLVIFACLLSYRSALWSNHFTLSAKWAYFKSESARAQYIFAVELEQVGFQQMAFDEMQEAAHKFNRLGFYIHAWLLQCKMTEIETRIAFPDLDLIRKMNHSSDVSLEFDKLLTHWANGECIPEGYTNTSVDEFIDEVLDMKLLDHRLRYKAHLLVAAGKFYTNVGNYNRTVAMWQELYRIQPTLDNGFRNVDFALKFGLTEYAREYLDKLWKINENMPLLAPDRSNELLMYEKLLDNVNSKPGVDS